jgi:pimeloyl-ACP methyl ester carboxylesterase
MAQIELSSGRLHYVEVGHGPPLILLHANPGDSRDFEAIMPVLSRNYRVIALDWPGYGESYTPLDPGAVDVLFYYAVFTEFLAAMKLNQVTIIGNSIGGNVAARFAAQNRDRVQRLVLVAPGGFTPHGFWSRLFCRLQGSPLSIPPYWFARLYLRLRTDFTARMLDRARGVQALAPCKALNRAMWRSFSNPENDLTELARAIKSPVLLVFGSKDLAISARTDGAVAARSIPHAQSVVLSCGHAPFAELPEVFLATVRRFLSS